jgi:hypothetical protein
MESCWKLKRKKILKEKFILKIKEIKTRKIFQGYNLGKDFRVIVLILKQ